MSNHEVIRTERASMIDEVSKTRFSSVVFHRQRPPKSGMGKPVRIQTYAVEVMSPAGRIVHDGLTSREAQTLYKRLVKDYVKNVTGRAALMLAQVQ